MSSEKQKEKRNLEKEIKKLERKYTHLDECFAENTIDIRNLEDKLDGYIEKSIGEKEKSQNIKEKIEIELDQDLKTQIDIISKAFNITPEEFIKEVIRGEISYIKDNLDLEAIESVLEIHYKLKINAKQLRKLL